MSTPKFVWYDLNSTNKDAAAPFYKALFNWKLEDWTPEGAPPETPAYTMIGIGDSFFAGINQLDEGVEAPSHWMGHIAVDDVDAALARATKLGAQSPTGAMDIPTVGRMAVILDPQGAAFSVFTPAGDMMDFPEMSTHGMVGWNELLVEDVEAAKAFYGEVVGWKCRESPMPDGSVYYLFGSGEEGGDVCGMMAKPPEMPVSAWNLYFTTKDLKSTEANARKLGGKVPMPAIDVPNVARMSWVMGPDGLMAGIAQWAMPG